MTNKVFGIIEKEKFGIGALLYFNIFGKKIYFKKVPYKKDMALIKKLLPYLKAGIPSVVNVMEFYKGLYANVNEELVSNMYTMLLNKNDNAIDIGANAGLHTDKIARLTNGIILAFEPIYELYNKLNKQYINNPNVKIINTALSDKNDIADFYVYNSCLAESGLLERKERMRGKGKFEKIKIRTEILDNYIDNFDELKFIKIDAESAEINILKGAGGIMDKLRPYITLEFGDDVKYFNQTAGDLYDYLILHNYSIADLFGNFYASKEEFEKYRPVWDFVLVPEEKREEFQKIIIEKFV